ncbi:syntaxin-6-like [Watersipora subatra]|uniref:syntaxin-6-like n=1 Tax=Watersipora subatra TaxID=2589382 RepID=UPI00355BAE22
MAKEDPYFVVRDDVIDSIGKVEILLQTYRIRKAEKGSEHASEVGRELRNSIRSIEWDLEDLQETVAIVERAPHKYNLTPAEVADRRKFIADVKHKLSVVKQGFESAGTNANKIHKPNTEKQSLLSASADTAHAPQYSTASSAASSNAHFIEETKQQQELMIRAQDEQIDNIGASVTVLKNLSTTIGTELEEQSGLLDDFGHEMEETGSRMDNTMKKIAKVTKMSNDRRQWCAIGVLIVILLILIILLSVL